MIQAVQFLPCPRDLYSLFFFFNDTATTEIYTLSLHDALPISSLNIRHNLSSSKGPKPLQLKLLTTYIPKTSALLEDKLRSEERFSRNAETDLVCRLLLEKKKKGKRRSTVTNSSQ